MSSFSVKKPYIVLVTVLMLVVLGITGFSKMSTDFLPKMNLPYMMIVTTYPGASPQKVEKELTDKIENNISTINGIKNVTSISGDSASQITLEFQQGINMDSAMVKVTSALNQIQLPDKSGKPMVMELSVDMLPIMYLSVDKGETDMGELSALVEEKVIPELKRQDGVAAIKTQGMVQDSVEVNLKKKKIEDINRRIRSIAIAKFDSAKAGLDSASGKLSDAESTINRQQRNLDEGYKKYANKRAAAIAKYNRQMGNAIAIKGALQAQYDIFNATLQVLTARKEELKKIDPTGKLSERMEKEIQSRRKQLEGMKAEIDKMSAQVNKGLSASGDIEKGRLKAEQIFDRGALKLSEGRIAIQMGRADLKRGYEVLENSRKTALKNANANKILDLDTLAGIISAQNFSMPAGYISGDKTQYLLRIDEEVKSVKGVEELVLTHIDGIGDITVGDIADVNLVNSSGKTYAKVNGKAAAVLAIYKSGTAGTSGVSQNLHEAMDKIKEENKGVRLFPLMDQGQYIDVIINSVFSNLIWGAILAFIVLLLFLRDIRPTMVVTISIPLSLLFAILLMYFADISMNIISMSGLALGVGMLVDNSIVVMENIYRLKNMGMDSKTAAIKGANQVAGAIAASTMTTICVFIPILFTNGLTRQIVQDMCLTITFSLLASLAVALTVAPAASATLMKNAEPKEHRYLEMLMTKYETLVRMCLKKKIIPLGLSVVLLIVCSFAAARTGVVVIPKMSGNQIGIQIKGNQDENIDKTFKLIDETEAEIRKLKGIETVGMIQSATLAAAGAGLNNKNFSSMILLKDDYSNRNYEVAKKIEKILEKKNFEEYKVNAQTMDTSQMFGSGLKVDIYGEDNQKLLKISRDVKRMIEDVGGFEKLDNGQSKDSKELVLNIHKDKAAKKGLTVAQVYQGIAKKLSPEKKATEITLNGTDVSVVLKDERNKISGRTLLNTKIDSIIMKEDGTQETTEVSLKEIADFREADGISAVSHDNGSKILSVTGAAKEGYNTALQAGKLEKKLKDYDVPKGYKIEISGETESVNKMLTDMGLMMLVAIILIYLVMVGQFGNFLSPFIVMFTIPLAFTGGFLALLITRQELSMIALLGFLILAGVVVNNGIVFVDYTNKLREDGLSRIEALIKTGKDRMRPIMMTALTTILAMSIMALSHGQGAEMGRGMAIVTIGGLLYGTLMTLFIVPVLYDIFHRRKKDETEIQ